MFLNSNAKVHEYIRSHTDIIVTLAHKRDNFTLYTFDAVIAALYRQQKSTEIVRKTESSVKQMSKTSQL